MLLAVAALLVVAALAVGYFFTHREKENLLRASGTIEATDIDVSFQVAGRVAEVLAVEGQAVHSGDVLARMDAAELTQHMNQIQASLDAVVNQTRLQEGVVEFRRATVEEQVTQTQSEAAALRAASERVREGSRPQQIRVAEADLAQAEAQLVQRRADFDRSTLLLGEGIIPRQQFDATEAALRTAEANRDAASQRLVLAQEGSRSQEIVEADARAMAAESAVRVAEAGRKEVDVQRAAVDVARARERELRAQLEAVRTQLGYTEIHSPLNGVTLTKNVESGEVVSPGTPVVTVADTEELWMNVYIPETQTGLVKLGQTVRVRVDSFPTETFEGKVTFVSPESEFTPKTIMTPEERVKLVYRVKLSLANKEQRLKPGMPADAEIMLGPSPARSAEAVVPRPAVAPRVAPQPVASSTATVPPAPPRQEQPQVGTRIYTVQVGAFGVRANADALVAELGQKYEAVTLDEVGVGTTRYHVRVGRFSDFQAAVDLSARLKNDGFSPFVVK